jgi:hypothetical protein
MIKKFIVFFLSVLICFGCGKKQFLNFVPEALLFDSFLFVYSICVYSVSVFLGCFFSFFPYSSKSKDRGKAKLNLVR